MERLAYCDALMWEALRRQHYPAPHAAVLTHLAGQLRHLPSEKSAAAKILEGIDSGMTSLSQSGMDTLPTGITPSMPGPRSVSAGPSLIHPHATPRKQVFDFLMTSLEHRNRHVESNQFKILFARVKSKKRITYIRPNAAELQRKEALAPVWSELLRQLPALKPGRQSKVLDGFMGNFEQLAPEQKDRLVRAFGDSFAGLASVLPQLKDKAHPDAVSSRQREAMTALRELHIHMSPSQRSGVANALNSIAATDIHEPLHPLTIELSHLGRRFRT